MNLVLQLENKIGYSVIKREIFNNYIKHLYIHFVCFGYPSVFLHFPTLFLVSDRPYTIKVQFKGVLSLDAANKGKCPKLERGILNNIIIS